MAEIERKFLVEEMPRHESGQTVIEQGYLALGADTEVRLRRQGGELLLTAKSGHGEVREEVEVPIEPRAFEALWPLTAGRRVRKVRHYVPLREELRAEVDVYAGALDGLLTAEIEFESTAQADRFRPPPWLGAELTGDGRYANRSLATQGLPDMNGKRDDAGVEIATGTDTAAATGDRAGAATAPGRTFRLLGDEDAGTGMRRVIVGRLDKATERLGEAGADGDALAEAIHGSRKDLKKARAALRLIRDELGEKTFKRENRALRDAARLLSASRDAEVKLATLDALVAGPGDAPPAATALWREALEADRDRIVADEADQIGAAVAAIEEVAARAPRWKIRQGGWKLLAPGLDTAYADGREAFAALGDSPSFEAVHELRKRGKDLWYQVRLLRDAWEPVLEATADEIHDFTDLLGDHHDLAVLAEDLDGREQVDPAQRETLKALIEARQRTLLGEARSAGARIYAEKPKRFARRLRAYWRAWRR
ncbi:MAG TPA: CHAD domain-containing protein [Solirubrobacterales bacterium]|nr:CHAD domain-containing protein [Solirubrobacterales bacterium]